MTDSFIEKKQTAWLTLQQRLGYRFQRSELLFEAFCHRSYANENATKNVTDNERLEFLGDAVLDLVVSDELLVKYPSLHEGELSKIRSEVVKESSLADLALSLALDECLLLGRGMILCGDSKRPSLLADALEALFGAIFLDGGFTDAVSVIKPLIAPRIKNAAMHSGEDYKTRLQEYLQALKGNLPEYKLVGMEGPDHQRIYSIEVIVEGQVHGRGQGRSKKRAEQAAAKIALEKLKED